MELRVRHSISADVCKALTMDNRPDTQLDLACCI